MIGSPPSNEYPDSAVSSYRRDAFSPVRKRPDETSSSYATRVSDIVTQTVGYAAVAKKLDFYGTSAGKDTFADEEYERLVSKKGGYTN